MSRSVLHDWECDIERISGDNANEILDIAQDIYNTGYVRGKNSGLSVLEDIKAEIQTLRNCSCSCSDGIIDGVEDIIYKHISGKD